MKHALIVAHPNRDSFTMAMACAYAEAAQANGDNVILRDLYTIEFDPCLHKDELVSSTGFEARPDVKNERKLIGDADIFALFYPLWFNAPPAMLKGYIDRVFGAGFGFSAGANGSTPHLTGRKLFSVSSSGAPKDWVESTGALAALRNLFDDHIAAVCGLSVADHLHFGRIVPGIREDYVQGCILKVKSAVKAMAQS